ncbi:MAG: efflux transporter periplasmic adaptor subunit [Burkholderiales bacterium PBB1]|nr:MAG: efflux transporter periplasmic adaptor subunit [Burkholderiales bacterium PBB1]
MNTRDDLDAPTSRSLCFWSCLASALLLAACSPAPEPATPIQAVYVSRVHHDTDEAGRRLSGTVSARFESELSFRVGGKIALRAVEVGQSVKQGQLLARLDDTDLQLAVDVAAQQWRAAQVEAEQASSDAARFRRLLTDGSVGAADLERQQARADAAAAHLAQAGGQLDLVRRRLSYAALSAPFDGVVTARRFETGQVIGEAQALLTLARPDALDVVVDVPESLAPDLHTYRASARLLAQPGDATSNPLELRLRELAPSASTATRTFRARYTITATATSTASAAIARLGNTVELHLSRQNSEPSALLPLGAVLSVAQSPTVWVVDQDAGTLTSSPVEVLSQTSDMVRVRGLAEGALVVSAGAQKLDAAMRVRAVARPLADAIQARSVGVSGAAR